MKVVFGSEQGFVRMERNYGLAWLSLPGLQKLCRCMRTFTAGFEF